MLLTLRKIAFKLRGNVFKHSINPEETADGGNHSVFLNSITPEKRFPLHSFP